MDAGEKVTDRIGNHRRLPLLLGTWRPVSTWTSDTYRHVDVRGWDRFAAGGGALAQATSRR
jgi:hypothetical protein